jgi:hypothetical protein
VLWAAADNPDFSEISGYLLDRNCSSVSSKREGRPFRAVFREASVEISVMGAVGGVQEVIWLHVCPL